VLEESETCLAGLTSEVASMPESIREGIRGGLLRSYILGHYVQHGRPPEPAKIRALLEPTRDLMSRESDEGVRGLLAQQMVSAMGIGITLMGSRRFSHRFPRAADDVLSAINNARAVYVTQDNTPVGLTCLFIARREVTENAQAIIGYAALIHERTGVDLSQAGSPQSGQPTPATRSGCLVLLAVAALASAALGALIVV
jgi:hypothetical protein